MTPTDFVSIIALGMLTLAWGCLGTVVAWMLWESLGEPVWNWAALRWRAWRGRDNDDQWHA